MQLIYGDAYWLAFAYDNTPPVLYGPRPSGMYEFNHTGTSYNGFNARPTGKYLKSSDTIIRGILMTTAGGVLTFTTLEDWAAVDMLVNYNAYDNATYIQYLVDHRTTIIPNIYYPRLKMRFAARVTSPVGAGSNKVRLAVYDDFSTVADPLFFSDELEITGTWAARELVVDFQDTPKKRTLWEQYANAGTPLYAVLQYRLADGLEISDPTSSIFTWPGMALTTLE